MAMLHKCTVMFLLDLAKSDWMSIPCDQKLLCSVVCYKNRPKRDHTQKSQTDNGGHLICSADHVIIQETCHIFLWLNAMNSTKNTCKQFNSVPVHINRLNLLKQVLDAFSLENQFPPLLMENDTETVYVVKFQRFMTKLEYRYYSVPLSQARGFYVCNYEKFSISIGINLFYCTKGEYISSEYLCDGVLDCSNSMDEDNCTCPHNLHHSGYISCKIITFGKMKRTCSMLYFMTTKGDCKKYLYITDKKNNLMLNFVEKFLCNDGKTINLALKNDLVIDCGPEGEDEPILMSLLKHDIYSPCKQPNMIPCKEGHSRCCYFRDICCYRLNMYNHLIPCRNGGHLQRCKSYECNSMFKCAESYCIPWSYACDGK